MTLTGNDKGFDISNLKTVYEEVCRAHDGIADFRAKLLALLPIASGAGLYALLTTKNDSIEAANLTAAGLVGALVTLGLFFYELRGIQRCNALSSYGCALEEQFLGIYRNHGSFSGEPNPIGCIANTWAALIIYPTLIGAWTYIALIGMQPNRWVALGIAYAIGVSFTVLGRWVSILQLKDIDRLHEGCRHSRGINSKNIDDK